MGRARCAVRCKILLMVFQRARGLDKEVWTSEEWYDFLAAHTNVWYMVGGIRSNLRSKLECEAIFSAWS